MMIPLSEDLPAIKTEKRVAQDDRSCATCSESLATVQIPNVE